MIPPAEPSQADVTIRSYSFTKAFLLERRRSLGRYVKSTSTPLRDELHQEWQSRLSDEAFATTIALFIRIGRVGMSLPHCHFPLGEHYRWLCVVRCDHRV